MGETHGSAAIENEARNGVSPTVVEGRNCHIIRRSFAIPSSIDCLGTSAATRRCVPIFNRTVWRPAVPKDIRDTIRRDPAGGESEREWMCRRALLATGPQTSGVAGDAGRAHILAGCGSKRKRIVRSKTPWQWGVGNSAAAGTLSGSGRAASSTRVDRRVLARRCALSDARPPILAVYIDLIKSKINVKNVVQLRTQLIKNLFSLCFYPRRSVVSLAKVWFEGVVYVAKVMS